MTPNQEGEFEGVYLAHCEDERIQVEVGKFLGVLYRHDYWKPVFSDGFSAPDQGTPLAYPAGLPFMIRFAGTPSDIGSYGHNGCCRRRVIVRQVLELVEIP